MKESIFARAKKARENKKGFTLVELIVVLVILAILAAILVPALLGWINKAKEKQVVVEGRVVMMAAQTAASANYSKKTPSKDGDALAVEINEYIGTDATHNYTVVLTANKVTSVTYTAANGTTVSWTETDGSWKKVDGTESGSTVTISTAP